MSEISDDHNRLRAGHESNIDLINLLIETQEIDSLIQKQELVDRENIGVFGLQKNKDMMDKNNMQFYHKSRSSIPNLNKTENIAQMFKSLEQDSSC
mmetsp:Transcript_8086/g.7545  ORF Transcript_8086/g.7545 Transcript_8086/m.7545 type:complete len:96 (+) Transcript_8086:1643-1930(+)|eukprot:CAMPEP_0170554374 /NCGR_PEP_ID=MMETSP0211-20121228/12208_1 /TAXON_ID=311385 /ORGANISM="Pseudokeronopsis sp., Strain OXSARD2" /LENGTH=95 /DNA_ID=CAMNT_0010863355 /DNA_START=1634 /DNA_END=1921 /DNA_ORIENTATION=-